MTIMMVAVIYTGGLFHLESDNYLYRWQYYVVSSSCFLLWIEMMVMIGRVPMFGKYVQMYRSVALEMGKFAVAYLPLLIGFMVMFIIMFSDQESFNSNFLGVVGKILVMMTGEFDYQDLKYQTEEKIS